jgi:hypothetical protein
MRKKLVYGRSDHFLFGFYKKKVTKLIFFKKNQYRFKPTGFGSVFLEQNLVQTGLARFFTGLARFFSGLGSVRFFQF